MALTDLSGALAGRADARLSEIVDSLEGRLAADPDLSFQIAAYVGGDLVLDAWGGPHLGAESLIVPYSVSKNTIGFLKALSASVRAEWKPRTSCSSSWQTRMPRPPPPAEALISTG